ncbi:MAG: HD domain-containing protein [Thermodesulfovibrionales bacterium]|nr:HD domain-containing protein [Thermodesulfovibrionales bacterium]
MQEEIKIPPISAEELASGEAVFTRTVSELGDKQSIVAQEDIYSESGIKLVSSGTKIKDKVWDKIVNHKLNKPITESVSLDNCITTDDIVKQAKSIIQTELFHVRLARSISDPKYLLNSLKQIILPQQIAKKFTVVRDARPRLLQHSIRSAIIASYLAFFHNLEQSKCEQLISAALFHDIGEMHIDPKILEPNHVITPEERRFINVHPITGYLMLQKIPELSKDMAIAVLHHHERLDGSGYPSGLKGNQISLLGQALAVAEVTDALTCKFTKPREIRLAINFNRKRFNTQFVDYLLNIFKEEDSEEREDVSIKEGELKKQLSHISSVYNSTVKVSTHSDGKEALNALNNRLKTLRYLLVEFGFDPNDHEALFELNKDEPDSIEAITLMVREYLWHNKDLLLFIETNKKEIEENLDKDGKKAVAELKKELMTLTDK